MKRWSIILLLIFIIVFSLLSRGPCTPTAYSMREGNESREIPLKIYQTWNTKELPEKMRENIERLQRQNPDFEYNLFDENDRGEFIKANFDLVNRILHKICL